MSDRHIALIIEDDPLIAAILITLVTSIGHDYILATTLEEALAAIRAGGYCYVLLDMQIPAKPKDDPSVGCGETALLELRRVAPQRTGVEGRHILPILVITSYSRDLEFAGKLYEMGANWVIAKPLGDRPDLHLDKIRRLLARAEREEHAACVAARGATATTPAQGGGVAAPSTAPIVRITIDGEHRGGRSYFLVNDVRASLQDVHFAVFLYLVAFHLKSPGSRPSAVKLGMTRNAHAPTRIRAALKGLVPPGFVVVETETMVGSRLNPAIVVERVDWEALLGHPNPAVKKLAGEWAGR